MTIEEKVAQLLSIWVDQLIENGDFSKARAERYLKYGIGEITRVTRSRPIYDSAKF
jgi:beta-glucosidase